MGLSPDVLGQMNHPKLEFSDIHLVIHDLGESSDKIVFHSERLWSSSDAGGDAYCRDVWAPQT